MKALLAFLLLITAADAQYLEHRRRAFYRDIYEATESFNSYYQGINIANESGWMTHSGTWRVHTGGIYRSAGYGVASFQPARFTIQANHEVEISFPLTADLGAADWHGVCAAMQPNGACYHIACATNGTISLGYYDGAVTSDYVTATIAAGFPAGTRFKILVMGEGATRTVTGSYNLGGGWVIPAGWDKRNFGAGKQLDGGYAGVISATGTSASKIDSITIRSQSERYNSFDQYAPLTDLTTIPGWTVYGAGKLITLNGAYVEGGQSGVITSDASNTYATASYTFPNFILAQNYEVEGLSSGYVAGGSQLAGITAAMQPDGQGYMIQYQVDGAYVYFGTCNAAGSSGSTFISIPAGSIRPGAMQLRLAVKGAGATRTATGAYNLNGTGWVYPPQWLDVNFGAGKQFDGGKPGIIGWNSQRSKQVIDLRVRNLP